jgi:hypothetical protein
LANLSNAAIGALSTAQVQAITDDQLEAFSLAQLGQFTPADFSASQKTALATFLSDTDYASLNIP